MSCQFKNDHPNDYQYIKLPGGMVVTRQLYRGWIHYKYMKRHEKSRRKPHLLESLLLSLPVVSRKSIQKARRK